MAEIGFEKRHRHYAHPECPHLFVEFVSGPIGIGGDTRIVPREVEVDGITIKILSPTDCVRDRLVGFIHYGARDLMNQASWWQVRIRWIGVESSSGSNAKDLAAKRHTLSSDDVSTRPRAGARGAVRYPRSR